MALPASRLKAPPGLIVPESLPASLSNGPPGLIVPEDLPGRVPALPPPNRLKTPDLLSAAAASSLSFFACPVVGRGVRREARDLRCGVRRAA